MARRLSVSASLLVLLCMCLLDDLRHWFIVRAAAVTPSDAEAVVELHKNRHCSHTNPAITKLFYGSDATENKTAVQRYGRGEHRFRIAEQRASIRIALSTLDLDDPDRHCTSAGESAPNFSGGSTVCTDDDVLTTEKRSILTSIVLPRAVEILSRVLNVERVEGNLIVPSVRCSLVTKGSTHHSAGIPEADYVLYVAAGPTPSGVLAFAGPCAYDQHNRPIAGFANFGPSGLAWTSSESANEQVLATAVHEILHALGFSYSFAISRFRGRTMSEVVKEVTKRGKTVTMIHTPEVVAKTREYFGCETLQGAELEDEGDSGSQLAHWDKRIFREELMAATSGTRLSEMTLAFMADSGHYAVDYSRREEMTFGRGAGCGFVRERCDVEAGGRNRWFCFDRDSSNHYCTTNHRAIGNCGVSTWSDPLPSHFQYFPDDPRLGGRQFMDHCPVVSAFSNRMCSDFGIFSDENERVQLQRQGFYFGDGGRCFSTTNLIQTGWSLPRDTRRRCLHARCPTTGSIEVRVEGSAVWLQCPTDGSAATINAPAGFQGTIDCPLASVFCDSNITLSGPAPQITATPAPTDPSTNETSTVEATEATESTNATTTPAPTPIPPTAAPTPLTPVPLSTLPTGEPQVFQFATSLSVGQFTIATRGHLSNAIAIALELPGVAVEVSQVMNGVGQFQGYTVVRFRVTSGLTQEQVVATLTAEASNASSTLQATYRVEAESVQPVVSCDPVCFADGTAASFRTADNTECICTCRNRFEGATCSQCPSAFGGRFCDQCAEGLVGYPACTAESECNELQPTTPRFQMQLDIGCSIFLARLFGDRRRSCERRRCVCFGGEYIETTGLCNIPSPASFCQQFICLGEERECQFQNRLDIMRGSRECTGNVGPLIDGAEVTRQWCRFDACIDSRNTCTAAQVRAACSAADASLIPSAACGPTTPFAVFKAWTPLLAVLMVAFADLEFGGILL